MNGMSSLENTDVLKKPVDGASLNNEKQAWTSDHLISFQQLCEQFNSIKLPENASPELKAEMSKTKELVTGIKEQMSGLMGKSADWLKEKGMKIFERTKKYLPALAIVTGATLVGSTASFFEQAGAHDTVPEILKNMLIMISGLITAGAGIYNSKTYEKFEEEMRSN